MKSDKTILAQDYVIEGGVGTLRPNDNVVGVGCSGVGKSLSLEYPTMLAMENASTIATFAKPVEGLRMAASFREKGYDVQICNLADPEQSDVSFDLMDYLLSFDDISAICDQIVTSVLKKTNDDYWNGKAKSLLGGLIAAVMLTVDSPSWTDVLDMFNKLTTNSKGDGFVSDLDKVFRELETYDPNCYAVREYKAFSMLPFRTASCVRDTLAAVLSNVFPESVRQGMRNLPSIRFERLAQKKTALFIIVNPVNSAMFNFANLIYDTAIKSLLEYSQTFDDGKLPIPVRLFFDDFACSAPVKAFPQQISIFRAAGLSVMLLLQSESQLQKLYGEDDATTILNNCSTYVYFPGGMDRKTCRHVAERMNLPMEEVMYAPIGRVFIMQSGKKPVIKNRYDIFSDAKFIEMMSHSASQPNIR